MSNVIMVQAGQCGNQLGYSLLSSLYHHLNKEKVGERNEVDFSEAEELETFFRSSSSSRNRKHIARCVCLDTEPKAINECIARSRRSKGWTFDKESIAYRHGGAGNNWSVGYNMCSGEFLSIAIDSIRRELEYCELPSTLFLMSSIGGGTGSG